MGRWLGSGQADQPVVDEQRQIGAAVDEVKEELARPRYEGEGVFAGGDSLRDYSALVTAAGRLPELSFLIATNLIQGSTTPGNVRAGALPHQDFVEGMRDASIVVVPMDAGIERSAGHRPP